MPSQEYAVAAVGEPKRLNAAMKNAEKAIRKQGHHSVLGDKSERILRGNLKGGSCQQEIEGTVWDWQTRKWVRRKPASRLFNEPANVTNNFPKHKSSLQGSWVCHHEDIYEKTGLRDYKKEQFATRVRRQGGVIIRSRRRGCHFVDLQTRRKLACRQQVRTTTNSRTNPIDLTSKSFPLLDLDQYLKHRASLGIKQLGFPVPPSDSYLSKSMEEVQHVRGLDLECETPSDLVNSCGSMLWHWPNNHPPKSSCASHIMYSGSCFSVSHKRGVVGCKRMNHRYTSERSISSLDSESTTVPLMTEPEPFNEYCEASTADLWRYSLHANQLQKRRKDRRNEVIYDEKGKPSPKKDAENHRSLSQKYRPKLFKDLIGQGMVVESLSNAIRRNKIAPVYLFHGPRGTGKTAVAKIFCAGMNCLSKEELRPCGLCKECVALNKGHNFDFMEVDATANSRAKSMRQLLKHILLPPSASRYKVVIIDDCHMLSLEAWNALLKSLEEPPSYVVFILITLDLEQLPRASLSRCQKFMFARIKESDIVIRLRKLALLEMVEIDEEALQFIASRSDGSLRDAETMLDQLSLLGKRVTLSLARDMVGLIPDEKLVRLLEFALSADTRNTVDTVQELMDCRAEPLVIVSQLATLITNILAGRAQLAGHLTIKFKNEEQDQLRQSLKVLSEVEKQLRACSDRATWLTAALLQLAPSKCGHLATSSLSASDTLSPVKFLGTREETFASRGKCCRAEEKRNSHSILSHCDVLGEYLQRPSKKGGLCTFTDNRTYSCDQSPQSGSFVTDGRVVRLEDPVLQNPCRSFSGDLSAMTCPTVDSLWKGVVQCCRPNVLKQLLLREVKLASLSVSKAFAFACLEFHSLEHKVVAERSLANIRAAFQVALGCPVQLELSLSSSASKNSFACKPETGMMPGLVQSVASEAYGRIKSNSCRKHSSSFRNMPAVCCSPRYHNVELNHSQQELKCNTCRNEISKMDRKNERELSCFTCSTCGIHKDVKHRASGSMGSSSISTTMQRPDDGEEDIRRPSEHAQQLERDHNDDNEIDIEYNSFCSDMQDGYGSSLLCRKGTRTSKGNLRRRRTRLLLRLVPCAKEGIGRARQLLMLVTHITGMQTVMINLACLRVSSPYGRFVVYAC